MKTQSTEEKRNEYAEEMCREIRWQLSNHGAITNNSTIFNILQKWMKVAKKNKYLRP